jgi:zinc transport system substrate-binding protein
LLYPYGKNNTNCNRFAIIIAAFYDDDMSKIRIVGAILLILAMSGLIALGVRYNRQTNQSGQGLAIAATFYPLYEFSKQVGGDKVSVSNLTPAGAEPHDYEPSPQDLIKAQQASVFVYNGGTMEPWVGKFLPDFTHTRVKASEGIPLRAGIDEDSGMVDSSVKDPHFWLDPVNAEKIIDNIQSGLSRADPADAAYFTQRAGEYKAKLAQLDGEFTNGLANCRTRTIITSHAAFGYLALRYNITVVSITGINPDEEPSAAKLAELSQLIKAKDIKYVFFERLVSPRLAQALAQETGARTAVFDPIEGMSDKDQQQGKEYISVQRENLAQLRTALACR